MELNPLVQIRVQQSYFPELYPLYSLSSQKSSRPFILFVTQPCIDCHTPSSKPYRLGPPSSQKEKGSIPTPEKSPSPNTNFHVIQASFIATSLLLYHFFNFRLYVHIYHANFDSLMVTESYLQNDKTTEWPKFLQVKFPTPLCTFQCHLENPASKIPCFPFYSFPFSFQT